MKFGKELAAQMVQEWQGAYMDYNCLKELLKDLMKYRQQHHNRISSSPRLKRRQTLYRAFSGLYKVTLASSNKKNDDDDQVILVTAGEEDQGGHYQTTFLRSAEEGGQMELEFFRRLDHEFNKVVKFYREKVEAAKIEADQLSRQMNAFIALRIRVNQPSGIKADKAECPGYLLPEKITASVIGSKQGVLQRMEVIHEVEISSKTTQENKEDDRHFQPAPLELLDNVKINVDPETPVSTLRNILGSSKSELSFSKEELRKAEQKLKTAFIEFYRELRLLKSYCFLNMLAFSKIMKKYDKITARGASKSYLEMVDKSYLGTSDEVNKLIERLEATFIKHFGNGNSRKGMKSLRPGQKEERHRTTFYLGLFTGCSVALIAAIVVIVDARNLLNHEGRGKYMETIFQLYSLFLYIVLHVLMYGSNTYLWRRFRMNYPFIFGFKQGTELGFREVFLVASGLSLLALAGVLSNLDMEMEPDMQSYKAFTELIPLGLVTAVLLMTFCPFNIIYHSSRFFFLRCTWHCIFAPLYKVTLPDFFLADQLTSQVQALRSFQFYVYYYMLGDFKRRSIEFIDSHVYETLYIVVAIIPFWLRFLQCLRRLFEEKHAKHGLNCLKYFSTIVALVMRTIYAQKRGTFWRVMAASTSGVTTVYNTYWDIVIDWGLLQKNAKNPWLRDKLLISNKAVYFVAIVVNILLRLVWMQLVLDFNEAPFLHRRTVVAIVACLEILRRGIWNFFRLENEHLNNVGKYRAFKSVPLPFHYPDQKIL